MWNWIIKISAAQTAKLLVEPWKKYFDEGAKYVRQCKFDEALASLNTALKLTQDDSALERIHLQKAKALFYKDEIKHKDEALQECDNALKCNKFSNKAMLNKAIIQELDLEKTAKTIIGAAVNSLEDLLAQAKAYTLLGKPEDAVKSYKLALKYGDDAEIHCSIGITLYESKHYAEAEKEFIKATKLCDNYVYAMHFLGAAYQMLGNNGKACEIYHKINELHILGWEYTCNNPESEPQGFFEQLLSCILGEQQSDIEMS